MTQAATMRALLSREGCLTLPGVFDGMPHQASPQSVWPIVSGRADCPVCGDERTPPLDTDAGNELLALLAELEPAATPAGRTRKPANKPPVKKTSPGNRRTTTTRDRSNAVSQQKKKKIAGQMKAIAEHEHKKAVYPRAEDKATAQKTIQNAQRHLDKLRGK